MTWHFCCFQAILKQSAHPWTHVWAEITVLEGLPARAPDPRVEVTVRHVDRNECVIPAMQPDVSPGPQDTVWLEIGLGFLCEAAQSVCSGPRFANLLASTHMRVLYSERVHENARCLGWCEHKLLHH